MLPRAGQTMVQSELVEEKRFSGHCNYSVSNFNGGCVTGICESDPQMYNPKVKAELNLVIGVNVNRRSLGRELCGILCPLLIFSINPNCSKA